MRVPAALRPLTAGDEVDAGPLRRMKLTATLALVVAAGAYVAGVVVNGGQGGWLALLRSAAEAAMVGGLADWFAVTALFRRPLGLPIPHTALVPRKKDELATKLGEFVTGYFLTPEALQNQLRQSEVVDRVGLWLADPTHARAVAVEVAAAASSALRSVDGKALGDALVDVARRQHAARPTSPLLGRLLGAAVEGDAQRPLVDALAARARDYLIDHSDDLHPTVRRFIEERNWITWLVTTDRFVARLLRDAATELDEIASRPDHPLRVGLEQVLREVAADLSADGPTAKSVDDAVGQLLAGDRVRLVARDLSASGLEALQAALVPGGPLTERLSELLARLGLRAVDDPVWHAEVERWAISAVGHAVARYGGELTGLIRREVSDWPAASASRRIELAVGRDLQFIRLNGTIVGALAGAAIHGLTLLLPA